MKEEKWESLIASFMDRFKDSRFQKFKEENEFGVEETHEVLMFSNQGSKFELERVTRPRVEDRRISYNKRRPGSTETVVYSATESISYVKFYRQDGGKWNEIDLDAIE